MKKLYALALSAMVALGAFNASAIEEGVTVIMDPKNHSTLTEFPESFTMTFEGTIDGVEIESIANNISVSNPARVLPPGGNPDTDWKQCTATWDKPNRKVTLKPLTTLDRTLEGEYKIELRAGGVQFVTTVEGSQKKTKCALDNTSFSYTVSKTPSSWEIMDEKYTVSVDPAPATVNKFPAELRFTFEGENLDYIKKPTLGGNPIRILPPGGDPDKDWKQCTPKSYEGKVLTVTVHNDIANNELKGDYTIEFISGKVVFYGADNTKLGQIEKTDVTYTIAGENAPVDDSVKEDLAFVSLVPIQLSTKTLDIANKTLETLTMVINAGNVKPVENALVTISGPGYYHTAGLQFSMTSGVQTWLKACFTSDPKYNGEYTLSIPAHSMGTELWFEDPEKGQTNASIELKFNVEGGEEWTADSKDTSFNPSIIPATASTVSELNKVTLTFLEKVFYKEDTALELGFTSNLQATSYPKFADVTITRVSDTELELTFGETPSKNGMYALTIPEGTFWNAAHEANETAGAINGTMTSTWLLSIPVPECNVKTTVPAKDSEVAEFGEGECVVIDTDNNEAVAKLVFSVISYVLGDETAAPETILSKVESTEKNADGAICWKNTGEVVTFDNKHYYELEYSLFDADNNEIASGIVEFDGKEKSAVNGIAVDEASKAIFNIHGVRVNAPVDKLPAGLYIIDGKKVFINK